MSILSLFYCLQKLFLGKNSKSQPTFLKIQTKYRPPPPRPFQTCFAFLRETFLPCTTSSKKVFADFLHFLTKSRSFFHAHNFTLKSFQEDAFLLYSVIKYAKFAQTKPLRKKLLPEYFMVCGAELLPKTKTWNAK